MGDTKLKPEDAALYEKFYLKYSQYMDRIALSILGDSSLSEDCVQEAFLKIIPHFEKLKRMNGTEQKNYLITSVKNTCYGEYRKREKEKRLNGALESFLEGKYGEDPLAHIMDEEACKTLLLIMDLLDDKYKEIFQLKCIQKMTNEQIAKRLDISLSNVRTRLFRMKALVSKKMEEFY